MQTKEQIRTLAKNMAAASGLINLTRLELAQAAGIPDGSFPHVMGCTFADFVDDLAEEVTTMEVFQCVNRRVNPKLRKEQLVNAAVLIACERGLHGITRELIAKRAGVVNSLVSSYLGPTAGIQDLIMEEAIKREIPKLVAEGIATGNEQARNAPESLKQQAANFLVL